MRAREGLPDQLTAACFHPPTFLLAPRPAGPLTLCSRPRERLMSPLARMQVAKRQLSSRELRTSCFDYPPAPLPTAASRAVSRRKRNCRKRHPAPLRPPSPFNLEKFQRVLISGALERTD